MSLQDEILDRIQEIWDRTEGREDAIYYLYQSEERFLHKLRCKYFPLDENNQWFYCDCGKYFRRIKDVVLHMNNAPCPMDHRSIHSLSPRKEKEISEKWITFCTSY